MSGELTSAFEPHCEKICFIKCASSFRLKQANLVFEAFQRLGFILYTGASPSDSDIP